MRVGAVATLSSHCCGEQAAGLFRKAPPKFHTLEYGAQALEEAQVEVPKELQGGLAPLEQPTSSGVQEQQPVEPHHGQPEIQEGLQVGTLLVLQTAELGCTCHVCPGTHYFTIVCWDLAGLCHVTHCHHHKVRCLAFCSAAT